MVCQYSFRDLLIFFFTASGIAPLLFPLCATLIFHLVVSEAFLLNLFAAIVVRSLLINT